MVGALFALSIARYTFLTAPNHDVVWLLIAAERMLDGGTYSNDFFEVNWPMAIIIYCPGVWLSRLIGIDLYAGLLIYLFALIGGSIFTARRLLHRLFSEFPAVHGFTIVIYAWVLLLLPRQMFGQREHVAAILFLPFVIVAAMRSAGAPQISRIAEIWINIAATIGATIKPHFVLLPAVVFALRLVRLRTWRVLLHTDALTFLISGTGCIAAIAMFFPGWFDVAETALQLYSAYDAKWSGLVRTGVTSFGLVFLVLVGNWLAPISRAAKSLIFHFGIVGVVATIIFLLQRKGWSYQYLIASASLSLMTIVFAAGLLALAEPRRIQRRTMVAGASAMLLLAVGLMFIAGNLWRGYHRAQRYHTATLTQMIRATKPETALFVFSHHVGDGFPMVMLEQRPWASRFSALWLMPGIVNELAEETNPSQLERLKSLRRFATQMTVADFRRYRPGVVLVRNNALRAQSNHSLDFLAFYRTDPDFEELWRRYRIIGQYTKFDLYVRSE